MKVRHAASGSGPDPELLSQLAQAISRMNSASSRFEEVIDPTLIDCCIYELKAAQLHYQFLLRRAKNQELQSEWPKEKTS